ncbi:linked kinase-associated serine/threonine phosphatase 2C [Seminavis robusta]|uniref:Linked kinase-associated serine/threonine phosphatase 2C n=1 Tax=Seminavis robusta TaxID=568900 RepID=A0A9N8EWU0_9STRA|nr:linked kinase-associated serine/threonine phosphatase 2C [Seminavis robusta]|eukprot:Sro1838_g300820.1 linked kinase-associated serine/threonine phosphatase 2C (512) ;mRNA; f:14193-15805
MDKLGVPKLRGSDILTPPATKGQMYGSSNRQQQYPPEEEEEESRMSRNSERRRRRFRKQKSHSDKQLSEDGSSAAASSTKKKNKRKEKKLGSLPDDEYDPYDSDPGESYRQHCLRVNGMSTKSCLKFPSFLKQTATIGNAAESETEMTSPPSPMASEIGDVLGQTPASLPSDMTRVRYSLRSSITDGSEKQPSGPSVMERRELRPNNVHINVSHWSDSGARHYMEDRYVVEDLDAVQVEVSPVAVGSHAEGSVEVTFGPRRSRRLTMPLTFFGVFDGHGGDKAAQYCADWLTAYIRNEDSYPYDLGYAMKNAITSIDEDFVGTGYPDGTTACTVSLVGGRRIICANAGDSRAIVVRKDGSVVRLSRDHKPGMPDETRRISELGGRVIYWGRWRVEGLLAVSRSIGDASLKPYITAEPEVCEYDVGKDDWFLILSSDGVWDVMDNEEAAHVVIASSCAMENGKLKIDPNRFKWAARNLCEHARSCGSSDNFSVVVVDLKSCGNPKAQSRYEP